LRKRTERAGFPQWHARTPDQVVNLLSSY
jgi:hypothetical protein